MVPECIEVLDKMFVASVQWLEMAIKWTILAKVYILRNGCKVVSCATKERTWRGHSHNLHFLMLWAYVSQDENLLPQIEVIRCFILVQKHLQRPSHVGMATFQSVQILISVPHENFKLIF